MKNLFIFIVLSLLYPSSSYSFVKENLVYTIGAYEEAFSRNVQVIKLGPLSPEEVPPTFPSSFLEMDGSYAGGEVFKTVELAKITLEIQMNAGLLEKNEKWYIYLLDADWTQDTYEAHSNDFRLKHPVKVLFRVPDSCEE